MITAAPRGHWRQAIRAANRRRIGRLAILSVHYNPGGYAAPARNYGRFRAALGPLAERLYSAEASFTEAFETDAAVQLHAGPQNVLWQKEAMLNLLLRQLPPEVLYVVWTDRDLIFQNPDWPAQTMRRLDTDCCVVQLFEQVALQNVRRAVTQRRTGYVKALSLGIQSPAYGYAWAARRDYLDAIGGFPSMNIIGGGDTVMAHAWLNRHIKFGKYARGLNDWNAQWAARARREMRGRECSYIPGEVLHLWHGNRANRQFDTRHQILQRHDYDPAKHVRIDSNGLLELHDAPDLQIELQRYFDRRNEDQ